MTNEEDFRSEKEWLRICFLLSTIPVLLTIVFFWDVFTTEHKALATDLHSLRPVPKSLSNFFGQAAFSTPQNLDFREADALGYPKHWYFPALQMLDGYSIHCKPNVEGATAIRIIRDPPVDAPPALPGFSLSQIWDAQTWKEASRVIDFRAIFQPKQSSDAKAYVSVLAYPKKGGDPSVFRTQINPSKDMQSYRLEVLTTDAINWMVCSIMMFGDGDLSLEPLSIAMIAKEPPSQPGEVSAFVTSSRTMQLASWNGVLCSCILGLSVGVLGLSYPDGKPILQRSFRSAKNAWREGVTGSCFEVSSAKWNTFQLVLFRIAFSFYILLPLLTSIVSLMLANVQKHELGFHIWLASQFGLEVKRFDGIAMGNTIDAMRLLTHWSIAVLIASVWWLLSVRATNFSRLHELLRLILRYSLFFTLLPYGTSKVFLAQFPKPDGEMLAVTLGKLQPGGLMWAFFGTSDVFNWIAGGLECLACLLLLFRRTVLAGSLLALIILANVVVLDFCYGIEVAVYASMIAIQALVLIGPDASRLVSFLFGTSATEPACYSPFTRRRWIWVGTRLLKLWIVGMFCYATCMIDYRRGAFSKKPQTAQSVGAVSPL